MSQLTCEQEQFTIQSRRRSRRMGGEAVSAEMFRYLAVSVAALTLDFCSLFVLSEVLGTHYLIANPMTFALGALMAYAGSVHWAFRHRKISNRRLELVLFIGIGIGGLAVNVGILWLGIEVAALSLLFANAAAAMASFAINFIIRKMVLFSA